MTPTVSAIVAVYNRFRLVKRSVESILGQTRPVDEIIVVDDGSTDETPTHLPTHIKETPSWRGRVRYVRQENQGQSAAFNNGIAEARGEWLAFNADDDVWLPQKLEWQFRALERFGSECALCFSDAFFVNSPLMKMTLFQHARRRHDEEVGIVRDPVGYVLGRGAYPGVSAVCVQTTLARTDLVRAVGGFDAKLHLWEDYDFLLRLARLTTFCFVSTPAVLIDRSPDQQRHVGASKAWHDGAFVLSMQQYRYEKMLRLDQGTPTVVTQAARKGLRSVHSMWATMHLANGDYAKAREAIRRALSYQLTPATAVKCALAHVVPGLLRQGLAMRRSVTGRLDFPA